MDTLEQMLDVQDAIATPFDDFDLVIEPFYKATCLSVKKVIGYFVHPFLSCRYKSVEAAQCTVSHTYYPVYELRLRSTFSYTLIKNSR
jgi:hypothetical protein